MYVHWVQYKLHYVSHGFNEISPQHWGETNVKNSQNAIRTEGQRSKKKPNTVWYPVRT